MYEFLQDSGEKSFIPTFWNFGVCEVLGLTHYICSVLGPITAKAHMEMDMVADKLADMEKDMLANLVR